MNASVCWKQVANAAFILDETGVVRLWNPNMTRHTGLEESKALGRPIEELFLTAEAWPGILARIGAGKDFELTWLLPQESGFKQMNHWQMLMKRPAQIGPLEWEGRAGCVVQVLDCPIEQLSQFFERLPDAFLICSAERIIFANQRCLTVLRRAQEDLLGKSLSAILDQNLELTQDDIAGRMFRADLIFGDREVAELEIMAGIMPFCSEGLVFYQIRCLKTRYAEDERRGVEEACYRQFFHHSQAVALLIDPEDAAIMDANEAASRFYGFSCAQLRNMKLTDLNPLPLTELKEAMKRVVDKKVNVVEMTHRLKSGQLVPVQVQSGPISYGTQTLLLSIITDISEQRKFQKALAHSERKYATILNLSAQGFALLDCDNVILEVNPAMCRMMGHSAEDLFGAPLKALVAEDQVAELEQRLNQATTDAGVEISLWNGHRYKRQYLMNTGNLETEDGVKARFVFFTDITEMRKAEAQALLAARVFETSSEAMFISDQENRIIAVNPAFTAITGYSTSDVLGNNPSILSSSRHDRTFYQSMWENILKEGSWQGEIWNRRKNGEIYPEWLSISVLRSGKGERTGYVAIFSDITRRKEIEEEIRHHANHDHLTDLPNRLLFLDRMEEAIKQARRKSTQAALLFIDLDRFKWVNDTMGHLIGDQLLIEVSKRLKSCIRESDSVARLGGDEFTILLHEISGPIAPELVAEKVLQALTTPFRLQGRDFVISASVGIALFPDDAESPSELLENADRAMYLAKESGRSRFCFYKSEMNQAVIERLSLERDLRFALRREEFRLVYQPLFHTKTLALQGAEALLRWGRPNGETLRPDAFLALAEETGLIVPIGNWVLRKVCEQAAAWREAGLSLHLSVNLSPRQCLESDFLQQIRDAFQTWKIDPSTIVFEFNETLLLHDMERGKSWLSELNGLGSRIALDDFGSGFSALGYLKALPLQYMKIDANVTAKLEGGEAERGLVHALVGLAQSFGMVAVAEGVETREQLELLVKWDCDLVQGIYLSPPLELDEFEALLKKQCK